MKNDLYYAPRTLAAVFNLIAKQAIGEIGYDPANDPSNYGPFYTVVPGDYDDDVHHYAQDDADVWIKRMQDAGYAHLVVLEDDLGYDWDALNDQNLRSLISAVRAMSDDGTGKWTSLETPEMIYLGFTNEADAVRFRLMADHVR